ncbi:stage V sporulation protein R [bacterium]|nr:stage V sporulation protein R [bacterium]
MSLKEYLEEKLMSDWCFEELEEWDEKISKIAKSYGLDWYPITYEVCDYYEMMGHMSYHGMPSHYNHWSYGKSFERTHQLYNLGQEGLPYELIINSNPSIAYLMRENPLYLQILIMAHCTGHSDFFKNNRSFNQTRPESVVSKMRNAKKRINGYMEDTNIGIEKVESFIDSLHAVRFQTERNGRPRLSKSQIREKYVNLLNNDKKKNKKDRDPRLKNVDIEKKLLEPDRDLLSFLIESGNHLKDWQIDLVNIVRDESLYFIPQIQTKILNEGWASFWHYKILHELDLPQKYHIPFLKSHNQVIRPHVSKVNPYHLGFYLFKKIEKEKGLDECFFVREVHNDVSALRCYLDMESSRDLNLFTYSTKKEYITIDDISDEEGWKKIKNDLIMNVGTNSMPSVYVSDVSDYNELIIRHDHDGRDLELEYAEEVVSQLLRLWPSGIKFFTVIEEESFEI